MAKIKQIDLIRKKCEETGLNIYEVFREAKVPFCTIQNWKKKEPGAFETLEKVNDAIEKLKKEKECQD